MSRGQHLILGIVFLVFALSKSFKFNQFSTYIILQVNSMILGLDLLVDHTVLAYKTMRLLAPSSVKGCRFLGTSAKQTCLGL